MTFHHNTENPWKAAARAVTPRAELALLANEYSSTTDDDAIACPFCGGEAYYRSSVGAVQCTGCGALERPRDGEWVR